MSVVYKDNTGNIKNDTAQKASLFLRFMEDAVVLASTPNTPKKMGNLRQDILKQVLGLSGKIMWQKNYAGYQEVKQYKNYTTAGTGPHYAENAIRDGIGKTSEVARKAGLI